MRGVRLAAIATSLLLLAGCEASGSLVIAADDKVKVDVTAWAEVGEEVSVDEYGNETALPPRPGCEYLSIQVEGLIASSEVDAKNPKRVGCHWTGVTTVEALQSVEPGAGTLTQSDSRTIILVNRDFFKQSTQYLPDASIRPVFDLSVTFPGQVLEHDEASTLSGTTVRWSDTVALSKTGMRVASVRPGDHPSPPSLLPVFGAGGLVFGGAAAGLVIAGRRGRRRLAPSASDQIESEPDADAPVPAEVEPEPVSEPPETPEDPSVWAPDADR